MILMFLFSFILMRNLYKFMKFDFVENYIYEAKIVTICGRISICELEFYGFIIQMK